MKVPVATATAMITNGKHKINEVSIAIKIEFTQ